MIIPEIKLSHEEMCEAIGTYIAARGINIPVELVDKNYLGTGAFRVTLKEPEVHATPEALTETEAA